MYIRGNSKHIKDLRMEKMRGKHWTIKFESDIKWIQYDSMLLGNCNCGNHDEMIFYFHRKKNWFRKTDDFKITICAENAKEDKELRYMTFLIDTDKYDTVIHIMEPGKDY